MAYNEYFCLQRDNIGNPTRKPLIRHPLSLFLIDNYYLKNYFLLVKSILPRMGNLEDL